MKYVHVNGANLAHEVSGSGPPVIFIHGFLARSTGPYYEALKAQLAAEWEVHALDMRGHGGSAEAAERVTLDQCARDVAVYADAMQLEEAFLVGHSMGGFISLNAAMLNPDRFRAIVALTPAAAKGSPNTEDQVADFMAARSSAERLEQRFAGMFVKPPGSTVLRILREAALCLPDAIAERWMRSEWPQSDIKAGLDSLRTPVLSLIGAKDVVVAPRTQLDDGLGLPKAKIVTYTESGHMLPLEDPERCATDIRGFLGGLTT